MSQTTSTHAPTTADVPEEFRARLDVTNLPTEKQLRGRWRPRSTSLAQELPALDLAVHDALGARIARISYTLSRWDSAPGRVSTALGVTKLGWFAAGTDPDSVTIILTDRRGLVLTIPAPEQAMAGGTPREIRLRNWENEGGSQARPIPGHIKVR